MDFKYLKNSRNLKAFFKGANSNDLAAILEKLNQLYTETKNEEDLKKKEEQARINFLSGLLSTLDSHNYTVEDLAALKVSNSKDTRPKMLPRYRYVDMEGQTCYWSGQGKIPSKLQQVMQRDNISDKKHYLIDED